ncbi:unnamed protein product [Urochloa decumbens]|uniref:EGF-like domain-containing protein n=1 Tax=Urochloa decumbens TaxID=240449 RepID=A0ABC8WY66_9POAL
MRLLGRSSTATEPMRLLLVALLACCAAGASVCDTAICGRGNCTEVPELIPGLPLPNYECHCEPGWSNALKAIPLSPCIVPNCSFDSSCLNLSLPPLPTGIPKDVCDVVSCGKGGACKTGGLAAPFSYSCECQPGYANLLNLTTLPCVNSCFSRGKGCSALGLGPAPVPESKPPPSTSPAPTGGHDSSGTSPPPSGTKGNSSSVPSRHLLHLLLLVTLAMAQVM